ncbi:MAG: hypothetical protein AAF560_02450 [Acidobacteriota bacterium]
MVKLGAIPKFSDGAVQLRRVTIEMPGIGFEPLRQPGPPRRGSRTLSSTALAKGSADRLGDKGLWILKLSDATPKILG